MMLCFIGAQTVPTDRPDVAPLRKASWSLVSVACTAFDLTSLNGQSQVGEGVEKLRVRLRNQQLDVLGPVIVRRGRFDDFRY
jgi:hypothetical protein